MYNDNIIIVVIMDIIILLSLSLSLSFSLPLFLSLPPSFSLSPSLSYNNTMFNDKGWMKRLVLFQFTYLKY